ncbi:hypothetical protein EOD39_16718 [Acipenser ruthenus]|uniref:Uncharacterized protein n=1 Tax=Acipenser ruthenus TaxID=7906 RepID=A0A444V571_ACIRT|nr:hypothetical protein EOD39_16718 [Acipenser ruthenus]
MLRSTLKVPAEVLSELHAPCQLTPYELKIIGELCEILERFEEVTEKVQGDQIITASYVTACVRGLCHAIAHISETYNNKMVGTMQLSLEIRLAKFEEMECFKMAARLDPHFILDWCKDEVHSMREPPPC